MSNRQKYQRKTGESPGTLRYIGPEVPHTTRIGLVEYNEHFIKETRVEHLSQCIAEVPETQVDWLNVDGIHEVEVIAEIGRYYHLHPLLLEDVLNTLQKPKVEDFGDETLFVVLKMLNYNPYTREVVAEHTSFVLGTDFVVSFQEERESDIFEGVKQRLHASVGKTRRNGADYLLYAFMDMIVDNYFVVQEKLNENLDDLEEKILKGDGNKAVNDLYALKRELTLMRKLVLPAREVVSFLLRGEEFGPLIRPQTQPFFRDIYDHLSQIIDSIDSQRELIASLLDLHLSAQGNKMNEIMKALTIISVVFLPLNLIVGFFGMNFENMAEFDSQNGQYWVLGGMVLTSLALLVFFRRRKWM